MFASACAKATLVGSCAKSTWDAALVLLKLVHRGMFTALTAGHESLRLLEKHGGAPIGVALDEPSWKSIAADSSMTDTDCRRVLRRADDAVAAAACLTAAGNITVQSTGDARAHPWVRWALRKRHLRTRRKMLRTFLASASFDEMCQDEQIAVVSAASAAKMGRVRAQVEFNMVQPNGTPGEGGGCGPAALRRSSAALRQSTRRRALHRMTVPKTLL